MGNAPSANWYPDPFGRHELRYWDGHKWTEHVTSDGYRRVDPPITEPGQPSGARSQVPPGWYPDPADPRINRYWDGGKWTRHAASAGMPHMPRLETKPPPLPHVLQRPPVSMTTRAEGPVAPSNNEPTTEAAILTESLLVVNQKAKFKGSNVDYAVLDKDGRHIGSVREVGRGLIRKTFEKQSGRNANSRGYKLQVLDTSERVLISMTRPPAGVRSYMSVYDAQGAPVGQISEMNSGVGASFASLVRPGTGGFSEKLDATIDVLGKSRRARFRMEAWGNALGTIQADDSSAWDFSIMDADGIEVARITKSWAGWIKERFTSADNYVVEIHRPLQDPLRSLVVAAALAVDLALKQRAPSRRPSRTRRNT